MTAAPTPGPAPDRAARLSYEEIRVGDAHRFSRTIVRQDVESFAALTGDRSPLHVDPEYGAGSQFGRNVVHGMLAGGLFSALVGMLCPGERALYLSQTLAFRCPVFPGDTVVVEGVVTHKSDAARVVTLRTRLLVGGEEAVTGEAKVAVR